MLVSKILNVKEIVKIVEKENQKLGKKKQVVNSILKVKISKILKGKISKIFKGQSVKKDLVSDILVK